MNMNKTMKSILNTAWYLVVFLMIQAVCMIAVGICTLVIQGMDFSLIASKIAHGALPADGKTMTVAFAVTGLLTALVFTRCRWTPLSRTYLQSRPWGVLFWTVILALGTLIPAQAVLEMTDLQMPETTERLFAEIMRHPMGYFAIGIIIPLAEEMVFRGAILRTLLTLTSRKQHWIPIIASAILFGAIHGNMAQMAHAVPMGILMGWLYYRTGSIIPGLAVHWVNNTAAYVAINLLPPGMTDTRLADVFQGNEQTVWLAILFSLCMFIPALLQLNIRLKKADA